jgi:hypothetical protein
VAKAQLLSETCFIERTLLEGMLRCDRALIGVLASARDIERVLIVDGLALGCRPGEPPSSNLTAHAAIRSRR